MDRDPIIDALHGARLDGRVSQQHLAGRARLSRNLVADWETDRRLPRLDQLRRWADTLGFDVVLVRREEP